MEKILKENGFESLKEFHSMIANVDLDSPDKIVAFKNWQKIDGTKEGLLKLIRIKTDFPSFWFEGNLAFFMVNNLNDLQRVFDQYKDQMTPDQILDKSVNVDEKLDNFGLRMEHNGNVTLRQFLTDNGIVV